MYVVVLLFFSLTLNEAKLFYQNPNNTYFETCVSDIIKSYFHECKEISMVNMGKVNDNILKIVNNVKVSPIVLRESYTRFRTRNDGYFIAADKYTDFIDTLQNLALESYWKQSARFLIMIKDDLTNVTLRKIFDHLLVFHVNNVVVMTESADPKLYSYNPFENYGCGQKYDRVIEYGKCSMSKNNLYPNKLVTGLRNCTFEVACPDWPPYCIDPTNDDGLVGVEEKILREIGKLEYFQLNVSYTNDAEIFTMIEQDEVAIGPLNTLQNRAVQMMLGGIILTYPRAKVFDYTWGHLAYAEDLSYLVKKAKPVASWKYTYLEFNAMVWTILIFTFIVFLLIFVILVRPRDKGRIILKMYGHLLLVGNRIRGDFFARHLFIHWVCFAYIINIYYVSNLVSLTFNPINEYQVSDEEDLIRYKMQPCVSEVIRNYLISINMNESIRNYKHDGCESLLESIQTVSQSDRLYTVVVRSIYKYYKYNYADEWGKNTIYTLTEPLTKAIYSIYFYKGFPLLERMHILALRLRENGFVDRYIFNLYWKRDRKYHFRNNEQRYHVFVPWYVLLFGCTVSIAAFLIEVIAKMFVEDLH